MQKTYVTPYPGFNENGQYPEPLIASRVRPEAEKYASRSKGCIDLFVAEKHTHVIPPPPSPRLPSSEAKQNYKLSRAGSIGNLVGGKGKPPPKEAIPVARLTAESMSIADTHKGQSMNSLLTNYGKHEPIIAPNPRVKFEGENYADLSRGRMMNSLIHNPSSIPQTQKTAPRVKPEAEETAEKGVTGSMAIILGNYGKAPESSKSVPRVKPEARETALLDQGIQMDNLFHNYGKQQLPPGPAPKVKDGKEMAEMDRGGRMSRLMHEIEKLPSNPRPTPRAASFAGMRNIKKNRGSIGNIFSETAKWHIVPKAGV